MFITDILILFISNIKFWTDSLNELKCVNDFLVGHFMACTPRTEFINAIGFVLGINDLLSGSQSSNIIFCFSAYCSHLYVGLCGVAAVESHLQVTILGIFFHNPDMDKVYDVVTTSTLLSPFFQIPASYAFQKCYINI